MRAPLGPGLLLWLAVGLPQSLGLKCGIRADDVKSTETVLETGFFPRIVGWRNSPVGGHPWQVSLKLGDHHFCGGSLIQEDLVVTQRTAWLASVKTAVQPISLPHKDDKFEAGILCMTSGWCKISETSEHSDILQVVELPIVDNRMCNSVLKGIDFPLLERTVMCASFPDGEENACQGDSGVPCVCRRDSGIWGLAGITSWRAGWTRDYTSVRKNHKRASLGIFSKVFELMDFITQNICTGKVCGGLLPSPLLTETNEATVTLVSRTGNSGSSFELTFTAIRKSSGAGSGCGSVAALVEQGTIHSANYSDLYPTDLRCRCFFHAPEKHIIKFVQLEFEDFITECSRNCVYDAVTIYGGPEEEHELDSLTRVGSISSPKINPVSSAKAIPYGIYGIPPFSLQRRSGRIVGREEACPHCWPWQVGVKFLGSHQCGGAILNPTWILTAAHCVLSKNNPLFWTIVAGDHDRALQEPIEQIQVRRTKHIVGHGDFDRRSYDSDIALIELSSPWELNSVVRPACLPESTEPLFSSEICAVTGWGSINEGGLTEKMMCAGFAASGGKDFCRVRRLRFSRGRSKVIICWRFSLDRRRPLEAQGESCGPLVCRHCPIWHCHLGSFLCPAKEARCVCQGTGPASLQINNESKTLLRQQLPPPTPSTDNVSGPGCYSEVELEEPRGFFSTPGYPLDYRGELECSWVLRVSPGSMAKLTVEYLSLPWSPVCPDSVMTIYEESYNERRVSGELHGRGLYPMIFMSSGPLVRVVFHSLVQGALGISYIVFRVQGPKGSKTTKFLRSSNQEHPGTWDDVLLTKPGGILQIPRHSHRTTMSCHGKLSAPLHHIIRLDIINFQMKLTPLDCQGHIWVYEGFGSGKKLIDSMRGKHKVNDKGCPLLDLIPVSSTEITSPNYPNVYPNMLNCTWTFYSKSGNKMKAVIKDFMTEESWNCEWDYFSIYDGPDQQSRLRASEMGYPVYGTTLPFLNKSFYSSHLCGSKKEFVLISSGAYLTMNFKTDKSVGERGFKVILEDIVQKHSQKSNMGTQLPITEIILGSNTGKQPNQGTFGIPVVDPFLMQGFERNTHVRPAEPGEPPTVGGPAARARSWPWLVSLQHHGQHFCGGALIAKQWVLTATRCNFSTVTDGLVIGRSFLSNTQNSDLIPVKAVYTHPGFAQFPSDDLSLLQLEKPVQIGEFVSLICLPGKDDKINLLSKCMTAGWGITEPYQDEFSKTVQEAAVLLISSTSCRSCWGLDIKNTNICGGAAGSSSLMVIQGHTDECGVLLTVSHEWVFADHKEGDSGGPLQRAHNGQYQLIGIGSRGSRNCQPTAPMVFARISAYRDWIASVTGGEA